MTTSSYDPVAHGDDTPDMAWNGWGDPARKRELPGAVRQVIARYLHVKEAPSPSLDPSAIELTPSAFDDPALAAAHERLMGVLGSENVLVDHESRLLRAGGKSLTDLLRRRGEKKQFAPDAVLRPADHDQVLRVLRVCSEERIAVVPFGGGTSVVGGVDGDGATGFAAVVSLDLGRLTDLIALDEISRTATLGAGLSGPEAERLLGERGYIIGHYPQSFEYATIGGFAASRSSGQASCGYGRFDSMVEKIRVATPAGELSLGKAPASAAGPDLRQLFLGSEGAFGVITEVTLRVHPTPAHTSYEAWSFPSFEAGAEAVRLVAQSDAKPTVMRLSDETETRVNFGMAGEFLKAARKRCVAITTYDDVSPKAAEQRRKAVAAVFSARGGKSLGAEMARDWESGRYKAPYMRDPALDFGVIVETLETACSWSTIIDVWQAVTKAVHDALAVGGSRALVWCHISHQYPSGASLYFTAVAPAGHDPVELWASAKRAACDAIVSHGATITHHHAVGRDHRPWLAAEIGDLGVAVLRAVKTAVDPEGVCNPGALIPPVGTAG